MAQEHKQPKKGTEEAVEVEEATDAEVTERKEQLDEDIDALEEAWEKAGRIWYETLRDKRLKQTATFVQFARYSVMNAGHLFGTAERKAVAAAWEAVGIKATG